MAISLKKLASITIKKINKTGRHIKKSNESLNYWKETLYQYRTPIIIYLLCINLAFTTSFFNIFKERKQNLKLIENDKKQNSPLHTPDYFSAYERISNPLATI